ncbi:MAG: DUF4105 domain-containing protein [Moraxellaceae bacterium]|nr:DUF4105 domain-containing protein [Moraxellaceae bacterium]
MRRKILCLLSIVTLAICIGQSAFASTQQPIIQQVIQQAEQLRLANNPTWHRLLLYPKGKLKSTVKDKKFFLSTQGRTNPQQELTATLSALLNEKNNPKINANQSIQCRFPARTYWLKQQLNLSLAQTNCPNYEKWYKKYNPKQFSMIFAQEYPDHAPSAFAHTLLKIETVNNKIYALNYTVDGKKSDGKLKYGKKAFTGGYGGDMSIKSYSKIKKKYLTKHQRDLWVYPLKLSSEENQQLLRHVWEVKNIYRPYYFLTDNCASETMRLIDVVRPKQNLIEQSRRPIMPSEVIRLLDKQKLLQSAQFIPATKDDKQAKINSKKYQNFQHKFADNNPTLGNGTSRLTLGVGKTGDYQYQDIGVHLGYHDLLDNPSGYRQNLDMEVLNLKLRHYPNKKQGNKLAIENITIGQRHSYNPINTARKGKSWGIELSGKQINDPNQQSKGLEQRHLVANARYEQGFAYAFGKPKGRYELSPHLCYALANGNVQAGKGLTKGFRIGAGANAGCRILVSDKLRLTAEIDTPYWYHGNKKGYWQAITNIGMQYDIAKNHGVRLTANHEFNKDITENTNIQLAWLWHF